MLQSQNSSFSKINWKYAIALLFGIIIGIYLMWLWPEDKASAKVITVVSRGVTYEMVTSAETISGLLEEQKMYLRGLKSAQQADEPLINGMLLKYQPPVTVNINDGGKIFELESQALTIGELLVENDITLAPTDKVEPDLEQVLSEKLQVTINRVNIALLVEREPINFETQIIGDGNLLYGVVETVNAGSPGEKAVTYQVTYENGVEIEKRAIESVVVAAPTPHIERHGRKIDVEATEYGRGSWYAYRGCMCAAHPFFPKGSKLRVSNEENGKSIIVTVNDFGPNQSIHPDRIIDLDSVAFKQLASLGAGTIQVKVEKLRTE